MIYNAKVWYNVDPRAMIRGFTENPANQYTFEHLKYMGIVQVNADSDEDVLDKIFAILNGSDDDIGDFEVDYCLIDVVDKEARSMSVGDVVQLEGYYVCEPFGWRALDFTPYCCKLV